MLIRITALSLAMLSSLLALAIAASSFHDKVRLAEITGGVVNNMACSTTMAPP
jgi:hypothetical protein